MKRPPLPPLRPVGTLEPQFDRAPKPHARTPVRGRHSIGLARIGLKRIAVRGTARPAPDASTPQRSGSMRPTARAGVAEPCELTAWSRGLYGVFLPERRHQTHPIGFSDRRV